MPEQLFVFIQFEFPWALGPADGRYLLRDARDGEPEHVVVLDTLGAGARPTGVAASERRLAARAASARAARARSRARAGARAGARTTRATRDRPGVAVGRAPGAGVARGARPRARGRRRGRRSLNRVLHMHRIAAADPYVHEVSPARRS